MLTDRSKQGDKGQAFAASLGPCDGSLPLGAPSEGRWSCWACLAPRFFPILLLCLRLAGFDSRALLAVCSAYLISSQSWLWGTPAALATGKLGC